MDPFGLELAIIESLRPHKDCEVICTLLHTNA